MSQSDKQQDIAHQQDALDDLNRETGVISWSELVRPFARGVGINVSPQLDLVEAAACLSRDDTEQLQAWLNSNAVRRASDDDARDWTEREPDFWCVVTAPWVLVQEKTGATPSVVH